MARYVFSESFVAFLTWQTTEHRFFMRSNTLDIVP